MDSKNISSCNVWLVWTFLLSITCANKQNPQTNALILSFPNEQTGKLCPSASVVYEWDNGKVFQCSVCMPGDGTLSALPCVYFCFSCWSSGGKWQGNSQQHVALETGGDLSANKLCISPLNIIEKIICGGFFCYFCRSKCLQMILKTRYDISP